MSKKTLRQLALWVMAADFPLLYLGTISLESAPLTIATLVVLGAAASVAALVY